MSPTAKHLRRVPLQDRSRRRLEAIVAAASKLFADGGFDGTTMEAIAAAADTSVGSVYQFFPNKKAVFLGIAEHCDRLVRDAHAKLVAAVPANGTARQLIEIVVDGFAALVRSDPCFRAVWSNMQMAGELEGPDLVLERDLVQATEQLMRKFLPQLGDRIRPVSLLIVQTISSSLFLGHRLDTARAASVLAELKIMLAVYLESIEADSER